MSARTYDAASEPVVSDLMTRAVAFARDTDTLSFASQVLLWRGVRHLPILDVRERLVGIMSDRDLLQHVLEGPAGSRPVSDFMSKGVKTINPGARLAEAAALLGELRIDALPVVDDGRLVGIVTTTDILSDRRRALSKAHVGGTPRAADVMRSNVITVRPTDSLQDAIERLLDAGARHLPVVDAEFRVIGIVSDRDVRTAIGDPRTSLTTGGRGAATLECCVGAIMTKGPITVRSDTSLMEVAELFVDERIGALPVVRDDDTLIGIISYVDVIARFVGRRD
ncbi:MAG: CBS domain-containing protein [Polyangiaceae bacterium]|nr:CBS domain-containing protein [Polyangiaceae bacterium]